MSKIGGIIGAIFILWGVWILIGVGKWATYWVWNCNMAKSQTGKCPHGGIK